MTKKQKIVFYFISLLTICLTICSVVVNVLFFVLKPIIPEEVFSSNSNSIVELRCSTESVGESFGTAEILSSDGKLITNAHAVIRNLWSRLVRIYLGLVKDYGMLWRKLRCVHPERYVDGIAGIPDNATHPVVGLSMRGSEFARELKLIINN